MRVRQDGGEAEGMFDYKRKAVWKQNFRLIEIADREGRERLG